MKDAGVNIASENLQLSDSIITLKMIDFWRLNEESEISYNIQITFKDYVNYILFDYEPTTIHSLENPYAPYSLNSE